jgi:hypothetical protein
MRPVKLYTVDGGFVVEGYVPAFLPGREADVLIWGERFFLLNRSGGTAITDADGALLYTEAFAIALVDTPNRRLA